MSIDCNRVHERAETPTGPKAIEAYLDRAAPEVRMIQEGNDRIAALFKQTTDPIERIPVIATAVDWYYDRWADYLRLQLLAREGALLAERERPITGRRACKATTRKVRAARGAWLDQLQESRDVLDDFVAGERKAMTWIWETLPTQLPFLCRRR
jgi:hypothetical protein